MKTPPVNPNYLPPTTTGTPPLKPLRKEGIEAANEIRKGYRSEIPFPDDAPLHGLPLPNLDWYYKDQGRPEPGA